MSGTFVEIVPGVNTINGISGQVTLVAGANVTLTPVGQNITIASSGGGGGGSPGGVNGNLQWNSAGSFAGFATTDGTDVTFPNDVTVTNDLTMPANLITSVAGFDASNHLISIPGWTYDSSALGANGIDANLTSDPFPDTSTFNTINAWNLNIVPSGNAPGQTVVLFNPTMHVQNGAFQLGNGGGGGAILIEAYASYEGTGNLSVLRGMDLGLDLIGNVTGSVDHITPMFINYNLHPGVTAMDATVLALSMGHQAGSSMSGIAQGIQLAGSIDGPVQGFTACNLSVNLTSAAQNYNGYQINPEITGATITNGVGAFFDFINFKAGSSAAYFNSYSSNPHFYSGSTIVGGISCLGLGPQIDPGTTVGSFTGIELSPGGGGSIPNLQGININLSGLNSPAQKLGLQINDGSLQVNSNFDTSVLPPSPGFFGLNSLSGEYHVVSGFPTTNSAVVGNGFAVNALFEDDMGPDAFGGFLGFTNILAASQTTVALGKTVNTFNSLVVGASVPGSVIPTDGGTITNMTNALAVGCIAQGGTIVVTNLYGFKTIPTFSSLATNAWGVHIADPNANNWFAKNAVIGGATGLPTGSYALDVIGDVVFNGTIHSTDTNESIDSNNRHLIFNGNNVVNWMNQTLVEAAGANDSLNWNSRILMDSSGATILNWSAPGALSVTGDLASTTLTPANGATGTFTTVDLKTVTVTSGIITAIV